MKKRIVRFLALLLLLTMSLNATPIPAQAAIPEVSGSKYIATRLLSFKNDIPVYADSALTTRGTASPYKLYTATVYATDEFRITKVNREQGWAYGSYPTSSGRKYGYIRLSDFTSYNASTDAMTSKARLSVLDRPGGSVYGTIFVGDTVYRIATSGEYSQLIFNTSTGYKAGWVRTSDYNKYINTGYEPQGYSDFLKYSDGSLSLGGWVFDRDNLSTNVTLHIYVGAPAGSSDVFAVYEIIANKYRPDVAAAFPGVGNYTGYNVSIPLNTTRTGSCDVYIYAINVGGGSNNPLIGKGTVYLGDGNHTSSFESLVGKTITNIDSTYYTSENISYIGGYKGQCTWFAYGRFYELTGIKLNSAPHAKYWLTNNSSDSRVRVVYGAENIQPKSIAVRTSGTWGHVMIVEDVIYENGVPKWVYFTEANADGNGRYDSGKDAILQKLSYNQFVKQKRPAGYIVAK